MGTYEGKLRLGREHKAFLKDLTNVVISYTPLSGLVDTVKFSHKWLGKRKVHSRIHKYMLKRERRNHIKTRGRMIKVRSWVRDIRVSSRKARNRLGNIKSGIRGIRVRRWFRNMGIRMG